MHPKRILIRSIMFYQRYISGLKGGATCRFEPSCSAYALDAVQEYGVIRSVILILIRLSKCGPWHPGGYDPVIKRSKNLVNHHDEH